MNLPELQRISEDQIRKIYPAIYYKKYASHVNVLKFQNEVLNQDLRSAQNNPRKQQYIPEIPEVPAKVEYNPRYDNYKTIIDSNKIQVSRMAKYAKALNMKLEISPGKKENWIRSPVKQRHEIDEKTLARLKAIQDLEYEKQLKERERRKKYLEQRSICKFVMRSKSNQISPRNHLDIQTQQADTNPQFPTFNSYESYEKPKHKLQSVGSKKISRYASFSGSQGSSKKQKHSVGSKNNPMNTLKSLETESTYYEVKKNLIEQTRKIRKHVESMQTLSYYDAMVLKKKRQQMLSLL